MIIKRTVDGRELEFELTPAEMKDTFYEQQHKWDIENVLNLADFLADTDNDIIYDLAKRLETDEEFLDMVVLRYQDFCKGNCGGQDELDFLFEALLDISGKYNEYLDSINNVDER